MPLLSGDSVRQDLATKLALGSEYAALISAGDAADAEEHIAKQLAEAVDEGEVDVLPALYAHRAVWRLQLGLVRKAEKDCSAALRCNLTRDAAIEVRSLLAQCYRELSRPEDAEVVEAEMRASLADAPVLSALTLRQVLGGGGGGGAARSAARSSGAVLSAGTASKADAAAENGVTAQNGLTKSNGVAASTDTGRLRAQRRRRAGRCGRARRLPSPRKAAWAAVSSSQRQDAPKLRAAPPQKALHAEDVTPNPGPTADSMPPDIALDAPPPPSKDAAAAPSAAMTVYSDGENDGDADNLAEYGKVTIVDLDEDELDSALNAAPQLTADMLPQAQQRLIAVMGAPSARHPNHSIFHSLVRLQSGRCTALWSPG